MAYSLQAPVGHEIEIKKSRFIARVEPVADRAQTRADALVGKLNQGGQGRLQCLTPVKEQVFF